MEAAAHAYLSDLHFIGSKDFARTANRVIPRVVERVMIDRVESDFAGKDIGVDRRLFGARVAVSHVKSANANGSFFS